jgi:predicted ribosome quality control (RQC) complex YloA/Tae2 family protein
VYATSDGFTVLRGKNARANEELLRKAASPFDYWFHVADGPGSHVILRRDHPGREVPRQSLIEAATLAALASWRARDAKAEVLMALVKDVRRGKGFAPGQVRVDDIVETLAVALDATLENRLRQA